MGPGEVNLDVGMLTKKDIKNLLDQEDKESKIISNAKEDNIQPCSYDMRIGTIFKDGQIINSSHPDKSKVIVIDPGEVISILTFEEVNMPLDIAGTGFAMNHLSSEGLLVLNPGHIDPGYIGPLSVRALNLRKVSLPLRLKDKIFTVVFEKLPKKTVGYSPNISREERETKYNQIIIEKAPKDLSDLITKNNNSPFPNRQEVNELIRGHWVSRLTLVLTLVAALAAVLGIVIAVWKPDQNEQLNKIDPPSIERNLNEDPGKQVEVDPVISNETGNGNKKDSGKIPSGIETNLNEDPGKQVEVNPVISNETGNGNKKDLGEMPKK